MVEESKMEIKLDYKITFLMGFGFLTTSIWSLYNVKMPLMLSYILPSYTWTDFIIGVIMVLDNITAIFLQPYFGALSDRTHTRFGKRIPYLMIGIPFAALSFVLLPFSPNLWMLLFLIMCFNISMALYRSPAVALMPDLTPSEVRAKGNAVINLMGGFGTISAYLIGAFLFDYDPSGATAYAVGGIIMLVSLIIVVLTVNEQKITANRIAQYGADFASDRTEVKDFRVQDVEQGEAEAVKKSAWQRLKDSNLVQVFREKEKSALFMLLAILSWFFAYNGIETFFSLYATNVLNFTAGQASLLLLFLPLSFIIFALPAGIISEKIGRRKTIKIGLIIIIAALVVLMFVQFMSNFYIVVILFLIFGIAWGMININSITVVWQLAPNGKIGAYTGIYYFFSAFAAIASPVIAGLCFSLTEVSLGTMRYVILFPYALAFMILAFFMMLGVKRGEVKLTKDEVENLKKIYEGKD